MPLNVRELDIFYHFKNYNCFSILFSRGPFINYVSVWISPESQERSKIAIALEKSIYSVKRLIIWHRNVSS